MRFMDLLKRIAENEAALVYLIHRALSADLQKGREGQDGEAFQRVLDQWIGNKRHAPVQEQSRLFQEALALTSKFGALSSLRLVDSTKSESIRFEFSIAAHDVGKSSESISSAELITQLAVQSQELAEVTFKLKQLQDRLEAVEGHPVDSDEEFAFERAASKSTEHLSVKPDPSDKKLTWEDMLAASAREEVLVRESLERMAAKQRRSKK
jgi:hypothetical protein